MFAATSLRAVIGACDLDTLCVKRDGLNEQLKETIQVNLQYIFFFNVCWNLFIASSTSLLIYLEAKFADQFEEDMCTDEPWEGGKGSEYKRDAFCKNTYERLDSAKNLIHVLWPTSI